MRGALFGMGFCLICWGGSRTGQRGKGAVSGRLSGGACEIHRLRRLRREPTGECLSRSYRLAHWFRNVERTQPPSPHLSVREPHPQKKQVKFLLVVKNNLHLYKNKNPKYLFITGNYLGKQGRM